MKSNVIMKSEQDRNLFGTVIRQETKTGFLNISDLQDAYEKQSIKEGWSEKRITDLLQQKENIQRLFYILKEQGFINYADLRMLYEQIDNHGGIISFLKKINVYKTTGARHTKTSWCDPYIWILLSLELHPIFYAKTVIWLTDKLILNRIEAGNFYKSLTNSVNKWKLNGENYAHLAKALNYIVFGKHEAGIRNFANQKQLKELEDLEKKMAWAVDMNYITSFDMLLSELRKIYNQKSL